MSWDQHHVETKYITTIEFHIGLTCRDPCVESDHVAKTGAQPAWREALHRLTSDTSQVQRRVTILTRRSSPPLMMIDRPLMRNTRVFH